MNGYTTKRATIGTTMVTIDFAPFAKKIDLALMGTTSVSFKVNDDVASTTDVTANYLTSSVDKVTICDGLGISKITLIASANTDIQWSAS